MEDRVFQGESALTLDGKGRLTMPVRMRDLLNELSQGRLTITKHPARCLNVFPRPAWHAFREELIALPMDAEDWRRLHLGSARDVELDTAMRVLVPPELREWAALERDVLLVGVGSRLEVWDRAAHRAHEDKVLAGPMPEALRNRRL